MLTVLVLVILLLGVLSLVLCLICVVQSFTGRQVIKPSASRRPAEQIRRESRWAAGEYGAMALAAGALLLDQPIVAFVLMLAGIGCYVGLMRSRAKGPTVV